MGSAKYLKVGERVLLSDGKYSIVVSVKTENCSPYTTYNLEVADFHTYYVGENGILVHNSCTLDPSDVHYTQDSIGRNFSDGRSVDDMITGLKNGSITKDSTPDIRVFNQDGKIFTLDNRRLYVFKQAGMSQINASWVSTSTPSIAKELAWKFTTINGGISIRLR